MTQEASTAKQLKARPSLLSALIPGYYQIRHGQTLKGLGLLLVNGASISIGYAYRQSSNDYYAKYEGLGPGLSPADYDFYYNRASDRRSMSNRLYYLARITYLYSWADAIYNRVTNRNSQRQPALPTPTISSSKNNLTTLTVNTIPVGADVYIDSKLVGTSPIEVVVDPTTTHTLQIVREGYEDIIKVIDRSTLRAGERERFLFRLESMPTRD